MIMAENNTFVTVL